ncbi:MAG: secondary thiamine-phosphate synthase enzyme YjbQ [Enterococcaceae bacterium]|nr:secondary thiamine-phosphate synthase enzyme YjbQ [Enterococcaceae bacterium]MCI1919076.1 secondary thiamine-phosphate synthase enzyme YjbQ [Enterococcaceae bacterium]
MFKRFELCTAKNEMIKLNEKILAVVEESKIQNGNCTVFTPHTTAGLIITSFWDPLGLEDFQDEMSRLIPTKVDFKHQHDTPTDAAGHIKSAITGVSQQLIIYEGRLMLGHSQGIYFAEFDGPRKIQFFVNIVGN